MKKGFFITFEGCEGCGKSTQAHRLFEHLKNIGHKTVITREPGGTRFAEGIRRILLDPANTIVPLAELLLYEAGRAQHADEFILPALKAGHIVICDRFIDATIAYQGYGRGLDIATIRKLNTIAAYGLVPDLTIYLDIPVTTGLARAKGIDKDSLAGGTGDRIERESLPFHRRVRKGYLALAEKEQRRIKVIRTAATIDGTHQQVVAMVSAALKKHGIKR
jgi:dTMP kinase